MHPFHPRSNVVLAVAAAALAFCAGPASAIVTASGGLPALPAGLDLGGVAQLSNGCSGVLLQGGQYVLASAHCAPAVGGTVSFLNGSFTTTVVSSVIAPGFSDVGVNDISVSRLAVPVLGVPGYTLATGSALPSSVVLAGYGLGGSGLTGASVAGGVLRWGFNDYEQLAADDPPDFYNGTLVGYDFDDGTDANNQFGSLGQGDGEAGVAAGDSGGPSFVLVAGQWQVAGIHIGTNEDPTYGFGTIGYDLRLATYADWVAQVSAVPEPAPAALLALGLAVLATRAMRRRA
jgi:hypothetical protein